MYLKVSSSMYVYNKKHADGWLGDDTYTSGAFLVPFVTSYKLCFYFLNISSCKCRLPSAILRRPLLINFVHYNFKSESAIELRILARSGVIGASK